jgi:hypothetical protein
MKKHTNTLFAAAFIILSSISEAQTITIQPEITVPLANELGAEITNRFPNWSTNPILYHFINNTIPGSAMFNGFNSSTGLPTGPGTSGSISQNYTLTRGTNGNFGFQAGSSFLSINGSQGWSESTSMNYGVSITWSSYVNTAGEVMWSMDVSVNGATNHTDFGAGPGSIPLLAAWLTPYQYNASNDGPPPNSWGFSDNEPNDNDMGILVITEAYTFHGAFAAACSDGPLEKFFKDVDNEGQINGAKMKNEVWYGLFKSVKAADINDCLYFIKYP